MPEPILFKHPLYPNYRFSKEGKVYTKFNSSKWREMKFVMSRKVRPYCQLSLKDRDGVVKNRLIHRIIAEIFIPNPHNYPCVNHKDENPLNNAVENLEWCTYQYNNTYGHRLEKGMKGFLRAAEERRKAVIVIDKFGNKTCLKSEIEAAKFLSRGKSTIARHIRSGSPCNGYILKLVERKETYA